MGTLDKIKTIMSEVPKKGKRATTIEQTAYEKHINRNLVEYI